MDKIKKSFSYALGFLLVTIFSHLSKPAKAIQVVGNIEEVDFTYGPPAFFEHTTLKIISFIMKPLNFFIIITFSFFIGAIIYYKRTKSKDGSKNNS